MCLANLLKIFQKFPPAPLVLPHPEEAADYTQTLNTPNLIPNALTAWFAQWGVPKDSQSYFQNHIVVTLDVTIPYPAGTFEAADGTRHLIVRPEWCNAGVIAHEQAHNAYALLTDDQKRYFAAAYHPLTTADPLIKLLYSKNTYGLTSDIEGHAEVYRYLGSQMPEILKKYYPQLF